MLSISGERTTQVGALTDPRRPPQLAIVAAANRVTDFEWHTGTVGQWSCGSAGLKLACAAMTGRIASVRDRLRSRLPRPSPDPSTIPPPNIPRRFKCLSLSLGRHRYGRGVAEERQEETPGESVPPLSWNRRGGKEASQSAFRSQRDGAYSNGLLILHAAARLPSRAVGRRLVPPDYARTRRFAV
jgi:hypothetical protein